MTFKSSFCAMNAFVFAFGVDVPLIVVFGVFAALTLFDTRKGGKDFDVCPGVDELSDVGRSIEFPGLEMGTVEA